MIFSSIEFLFFLPVVFIIYWLLNRQLKWQNLFVVAASYFFYGWWNWRFLGLIAFTSLCSFYSGIWIENALNSGRRRKAKWFSICNILVNLSILALFKYYDFFASSLSDAFTFLGNPIQLRTLQLVLPVGISFYTFQALSYSIDIFKQKMPATRDVVVFLAYVSFFPQLVAGPIERATNLLPQFSRARRFESAEALDGLKLMLWGFFKKMVLADTCAFPVNDVYAHPDIYSGSTLFLAAWLFFLQIYGDFSGYSDIAIGTSKLFGIRLMRNFNVPYFSRNIAEYWRRWHISLSTWFRDYVYFPLGGSRCSTPRMVRNILVLFLVSGLWHGAAWTFVVWGGVHGIFTLLSRFTGHGNKYNEVVAVGRFLPSWHDALSIMVTNYVLMSAFVIFRSDSLSSAMHFFREMYAADFFSVPRFQGMFNVDALFGLAFGCITLIIEWVNRERNHALDFRPRTPGWVRTTCYAVILATIYCFGMNDAAFIYFQF